MAQVHLHSVVSQTSDTRIGDAGQILIVPALVVGPGRHDNSATGGHSVGVVDRSEAFKDDI